MMISLTRTFIAARNTSKTGTDARCASDIWLVFGRGNDPFETFSGFGRNDGGSNKRRVIVQTTTTTVEHESDSFFNLGNILSFQMLGNNDDGYM